MAMEDFRVDVDRRQGRRRDARSRCRCRRSPSSAPPRAPACCPAPLRDRFGFTGAPRLLLARRARARSSSGPPGCSACRSTTTAAAEIAVPLPRHPPHREPAAAPRARLGGGARRRHARASSPRGPRWRSTRSTSSASTGSTARCSTALCTPVRRGTGRPDDARGGRRRGARDRRDGRRAVPRARGPGRPDAARPRRDPRGLGAPRARGPAHGLGHTVRLKPPYVSRSQFDAADTAVASERRAAAPRLRRTRHPIGAVRCGSSSSSWPRPGRSLAHVEPYAQAAARGAGVPEQPRRRDEVMTASGLLGTVVDVEDDVITLESSPGSRTRAGSAPRSRRRSSRRSRRSTTSTDDADLEDELDDQRRRGDRCRPHQPRERRRDRRPGRPVLAAARPQGRGAGHQVDRSVRVTTPGPRPHRPPARPVRAREKNSVGSSYTPSEACPHAGRARPHHLRAARHHRGGDQVVRPPPGRRTSPSTSRAARRSS